MSVAQSKKINLEDQFEIHEKISLYGHLLDEHEYSRLSEIFSCDANFDLSGYGGINYTGLKAIVELMENSEEHPVAHHASNVVIEKIAEGCARVKSKGLGVGRKGRVGSVTYTDIFTLTSEGWRISRRQVTLRGFANHKEGS